MIPSSPTPSATPPAPITPAPVSTLIAVRPDGSEDRTCGKCGAEYWLPFPYEKCNVAGRDMCADCLHKEQYRRLEEEKEANY